MQSVTYRTLPRSDGRTSVVVTTDPLRPEDPEVVQVFENPTVAVDFVLGRVKRIAVKAKVPVVVDVRMTLEPEGRGRIVAKIARAPSGRRAGG